VAADGSISVAGASRAVPVRFQGDLLGGLSVQKSPGDPLTAVDDKLLADVAAQAGLVLHNVRLIEELRASRQRMVTAQDEARRRLERNIHDGAQQQLVALAVKLNLVGAVVGNDDDKARAIIDQLKVEANDALENLRDLARGIYPPLLADRGLVPALEAQARKSAIPVTLETDGVGRYPQEVEAAVYFCTLEALQNIAKYSRATAATVRLRGQDGVVTFEVHDDGAGFDPRATTYGSGLQGMADRLSALGGRLEIRSSVGQGTTVAGELPAAVVGASTPG
jgi:signal transduction histidine kinase